MTLDQALIAAVVGLVGAITFLFAALQKGTDARIKRLQEQTDECEDDRRLLWRYNAHRDNGGDTDALISRAADLDTTRVHVKPPDV